MVKCYSACRKVHEEKCTHEECKYVDGTRFQYCRLSHKYKMDEDCVPQIKPEKAKTQRRRLDPKVAAITIKRHRAAQKINQFMRKVDPNKRRAYFLRSICSDAGVCIAFGKELKTINKHFNGFADFKHIKLPVNQIGFPSNNGFVNEITYEHSDYVANAILKSSSRPDSDNLFYEYLVGQYINKQCKIFPAFVETYGWFTYKSNESWNLMKSNSKKAKDLPNHLQLQSPTVTPESLGISCKKSKYLALLIQHIKDAKALETMAANTSFVKYHLPKILYQVYMPLATLENDFTHYDLHLNNVLIYEPVKGQYIDYHYKLIDGTSVRFKSLYIAKIIDYGRSFFVDSDESSKSIYKKICKTNTCDPNCGEDNGFGILTPEDIPGSFYYISSTKRNMSHDLRLLNELILQNLPQTAIFNHNPDLYNLLHKVLYGNGISNKSEKRYGTKEQSKSGLPKKIVNVKDAETAFRTFLTEQTNDESMYDTMKSLGTLTIHQDGKPMSFSPSV